MSLNKIKVNDTTTVNTGVVYDITKATSQSYTDLKAALGTDGNNVPLEIREGGMSVRFVQTSDNKYVQCRLLTQEFSTNSNDWVVNDEEFLINNPDYIYALVDSNNNLLAWLRKSDGGVDWIVGVPKPVKDYVDVKVAEILEGNEGTDIDGLNKIIAFLDGFSTSNTLALLLNTKVDKEEGKELIDREFAESVGFISSMEFLDTTVDKEGYLLEGQKSNGNKYFGVPVENKADIHYAEQNLLYIDAIVDEENSILQSRDKNGHLVENVGIDFGTIYAQNTQKKIIADSIKSGSDISLLWFADVHGSNDNVLRTVLLSNYWGHKYFDIILNTGDTVLDLASDGLSWYDNIVDKSNIPILTAVGNHDMWKLATPGDWNTRYNITQAEAYNLVTKKVVETANVVSPGNNATYYYKDIGRVRIIVLDSNYWDTAQESWFEDTLTSAYNNNLYVIAAIHHPFYTAGASNINITMQNTGFNSYLAPGGDFACTPMSAASIVKNFIDGGGCFICWLQGHAHRDVVYKLSADYDNQLCIVNGSANSIGNPSLYYPDEVRNSENYTFDHLNMLSVDVDLGVLKMMRIGCDIDKKMRMKKYLVFDFIKNSII